MKGKDFNLSLYSEEDLSKLPDREREAIILYFARKQTLDSIGKRFNVTRTRAAQLRDQGIRRLRGMTGKG